MSKTELTSTTIEKKSKKDKSAKKKDKQDKETTAVSTNPSTENDTPVTTPSKKRKRDEATTTVTVTLPSPNTSRGTGNDEENGAEELEIDVTAPEPPSRKDLRKLKKLQSKGLDIAALQAAKVPLVDISNKGAQQDEPQAQKNSKHSPYGVWIGNLTFNTTRDDLFEFFTRGFVAPKLTGANHGADVSTNNNDDDNDTKVKDEETSTTGITKKDITRINLPKSTRFPKQNKGFAYIDFLTPNSIPLAVLLSERLIHGRKVLIKASTDFQGRPDAPKPDAADGDTSGKGGKNPPSKSVFVGNLGFETTEDDLIKHFEPAGRIKKVRMTTFEDSGKCKGFGWIDFEEMDSAKHAIFGVKLGGGKSGIKLEDDSSDQSSDDDDDDKPQKKKRKHNKDVKKRLFKRFDFLAGRKLRLEYGEDATTRYNKRHKKEGGGDRDGGGVDGERGGEEAGRRGGNVRRPRMERKVDARTIAPGAALAKAMEQRLTARIVEGTGKKTTFD